MPAAWSYEDIDAGKEEDPQPMLPTDHQLLQYQRAFRSTAATVRLHSTYSFPHHKKEKRLGMNVYGPVYLSEVSSCAVITK